MVYFQSLSILQITKAFYGLKHASCQWFAKLFSFLLCAGYTQSRNDYSFFDKAPPQSFKILLVYMDDIIITSNDAYENPTDQKCP